MNTFTDLNKKIKKKVAHQQDNYMMVEGKPYTLDGESLEGLYVKPIEPKYIPESQLKAYESKKILGDHETENGGFIFMFYKTLQNFNELIPDLNKPDIARLLFLSTYISFEENKIQYDNGKDISDKDLIDLLRLNRNSYNKFIHKLIDNNILLINENDEKYLSPSFCKYGSIDVSKLKSHEIGYIRLFRGTVRVLFNNTPIRELGRLSTIYLILPYINLATNIVSYNPEEQDTEKVEPMPLLELSDMLEYSDYTKFRQSLYNIKIRNEVAFAFILTDNDKRTMKMVINPNIVFAGNADQLQLLKVLFKEIHIK